MTLFVETRKDLTHTARACTPPAKETAAACRSWMSIDLRRILTVMLEKREFLLAVWDSRGLLNASRAPIGPTRSALSIGGITPANPRPVLWRQFPWALGPVWFLVNLSPERIAAKFHHYLGDYFKVGMPTGRWAILPLWEVTASYSLRITRIFLKGPDQPPVHGAIVLYQADPNWHDLVLFYEYFHGRQRFRLRREPTKLLDRCCGQHAIAAKRRAA